MYVHIAPYLEKIDSLHRLQHHHCAPIHRSFSTFTSFQMSTVSLDTLSQQLATLADQMKTLQTQVLALAKAGGVEVKGKKVKKVRDPAAPKRPANPYINFTNAKRAEVKAAHPEAKIGEISKIIGGMWGLLTADQKAAFKAPAA